MNGAYDTPGTILGGTFLAFAIVDTEALLEAALRAINGGIIGKR